MNVIAYAMEGPAIYQTSWLFGVPSLMIRGVSNLYQSNGRQSDIERSQTHLASKNAAKFVVELFSVLP